MKISDERGFRPRRLLGLAIRLLIVVCISSPADAIYPYNSPEKLLEEKIKSNYSKYDRPLPADDGATIINVTTYFRTISMIDEIKMEFTADLSLKLYWNDPGLSYKEDEKEPSTPASLLLDPEISNKIWQPDIFFPNLRSGNLFDLTLPNRFILVKANGDIEFAARYSLTFSCNMDFSLFPFDKQICVVTISSYHSPVEAIVLQWHENMIILDEDFTLPKFMLIKAITSDCSTNNTRRTQKISNGQQSCLRLQLYLIRELHLHIMETFLPTILFVVASWLSFWIDPSAAPGRISLPVVLMLTIVELGNTNKRNLPPVPYVNALDVWLDICICFVFLSLVEYAVVNFLFVKARDKKPVHLCCPGIIRACGRLGSRLRRHKKEKRFNKPQSTFANGFRADSGLCEHHSSYGLTLRSLSSPISTIPPKPNDPNNNARQTSKEGHTINAAKLHQRVDQVSRVVFPCCFIIALIVYFTIVTAKHKHSVF